MRMGICCSDFYNIDYFSLPTYADDVEVKNDERECADGDVVEDDEDECTIFYFALLTHPYIFIYFFVNLWASLDSKCLLVQLTFIYLFKNPKVVKLVETFQINV